jgi:hypothetical protein
MNRQEHIHIISAGEHIDKAYPGAIRDLPTVTRTFVFADSAVYEISRTPDIEKMRQEVRSAVSQVKETSRSLSIPFSLVYIRPPAYLSSCDAVLRIHREFPGARYSFYLSGGSKPLCIALFAVSLWLDSEVYSALDEHAVQNIPLPVHSSRTILSNPNYQTILAILSRNTGTDHGPELSSWISRQYIFSQMKSWYVPIRGKGKKTQEDGLTHGTLSDFMAALVGAGFVREEIAPRNKREKVYSITHAGELAFRFFSDPATSTIVSQALGEKLA